MSRNLTKYEKSKLAQRGMSAVAEARLRRALRRKAPSEPWVDAQFATIVENDGREEIVRRVHDASVFPPGGAKTSMRRCPWCGVMTPTHAFEGGICLDHRERGAWGRSPSAMAIAALQHMNLRLIEVPLPGESVVELRAEIARFIKRAAKQRRRRQRAQASLRN